ncbi:MAG: hypothetical protein J6W67_01580 [Lentisphaeria bacterium]|nr:hypothetical protein [Lentisphaeria bacterium]
MKSLFLMITAAFSAFFLLTGCVSEKIVEKSEVPSTLTEALERDWNSNSDVIRDTVFQNVREETIKRRGLFAAVAHLNSRKAPGIDEKLRLLDDALLYAVTEIHLPDSERVMREQRKIRLVKIYSDIEFHLALERAGMITAQERSQFGLLKSVLAVEMDIEADKLVKNFDFATLPEGTKKLSKAELPNGMDDGNLLKWVKLLYNLPQESMRTLDIDRRKLAALIIEISRRHAVRCAAKEAAQVESDSGDVRSRAARRYRERQLAARFSQNAEKVTFSGKEFEFLRDMYMLAE